MEHQLPEYNQDNPPVTFGRLSPEEKMKGAKAIEESIKRSKIIAQKQNNMSKPEVLFPLYDGRYRTEPDRAVCFEICDTLHEAKKQAPEYGSDTVIVKSIGTWDDNNFTEEKSEILN